MVEVEIQENSSPMVEVFGGGMEDMGSNIKDMLGSLVPKKTKTKQRAHQPHVVHNAHKFASENSNNKLPASRSSSMG